MINLMYIVLIAMLALNISSDVLVGFELVGESVNRTVVSASEQNKAILTELAEANRKNPDKAGEWYDKATLVHREAQTLFNLAEELKSSMVKYADGEAGDPANIRRRDNQEAASHIMLSPAGGRGRELHHAIAQFRLLATSVVEDPGLKSIIENSLSTEVARQSAGLGKNWEEMMFESMPLIAAVTILSKLQSDVLHVESEVLHKLSSNVDKKDVRVNVLKPYVIPTSKHVIAGGKYMANIILAAIDSTQQPDIYIDSRKLPASSQGYYEEIAGRSGQYTMRGHIEVNRGDGETVTYPFEDSYTVVEPTATVSATMMNLLYAGIDNPVSISVPGFLNHQVTATMTNGSLTRQANGSWSAKPSRTDQDAEITVTAAMEGRSLVVNKSRFRVRPLPPPSPFITYKNKNGVLQKYRGGTPLPKSVLLGADGIKAAIDDDILNINFKVLSFETVVFDSMGNALPEVSQGASFSQRQKESFRRLSRGKRFYISRVKAVGPDGVEQTLTTSLEVIVQ